MYFSEALRRERVPRGTPLASSLPKPAEAQLTGFSAPGPNSEDWTQWSHFPFVKHSSSYWPLFEGSPCWLQFPTPVLHTHPCPSAWNTASHACSHAHSRFTTNWRIQAGMSIFCFYFTLTFINVRCRYNSLHGLLLLCESEMMKMRLPLPLPLPPSIFLRLKNPFLSMGLGLSQPPCDTTTGAADTAVRCDWIQPPVTINLRWPETRSKSA